MKRFICLLLGLGVAMTLCADEREKELERITGKWSVERIEENGVAEPADEAKRFTITIKNGTFTVELGGREETMSFKIDPTKTPKTIDLTPNYGNDKDKTSPGIYELDGETLRICARPKGERPDKFISDKGILNMVLKRQKK